MTLAIGTASTASAALIINITDDANGFYTGYAGTIDLTGVTSALALGGASPYGIGYSTGRLDASYLPWYKNYMLGFGALPTGTGWGYPFTSGPAILDVINDSDVLTRFDAAVQGSGLPIFLAGGGNGFFGVGIEKSYVSGEFIRGSNAWTGDAKPPTDLAGSMFNLGRYVYTLENDETITLNIGNAFAQPLADVPLPAGLPMLTAGLGGLAVLRRKRG